MLISKKENKGTMGGTECELLGTTPQDPRSSAERTGQKGFKKA